ncbi:MAG: hypothetical protein KKG99_11240 [Bacteroidetes bacterium]|nr:hypothetical protein [Bacteroidota bacterium]
MELHGRKIFDSYFVNHENYDSVRPGYPNIMFDDLKNNLNITPTKKILEIESDSSKTLKKIAEFGCDIIGIETRKNIIPFTQDTNTTYSNVNVVGTNFEQYHALSSYYDVIIDFKAFHLTQNQEKYKKVLEVLAENGSLVLIWNSFLQTQSAVTFEIEKLFRKYLYEIYPSYEETVNTRVFYKVEQRMIEILNQPDLVMCFMKRYYSLYHYDKVSYPEFLNTYPKINSIDKCRRDAFLRDVGETIQKFKEITVPIMTIVLIMQKRNSIVDFVSSMSSPLVNKL